MSAHLPPSAAGNRSLMRKLLAISVVMFGFGWALIPIYRKICEIAGINQLESANPAAIVRARNSQIDTSRKVTVEFDANRKGAWLFKPLVSHLDVHPGELVHVDYDLTNLEGRAMAGQAIPSYAPARSQSFFEKLECFCFKQQTLAAGETRRFPVVFFVSTSLPKDITQITLSYTFFEVPAGPTAAAPGRS